MRLLLKEIRNDPMLWLLVFVAPLVIPAALVAFGVMWFRRKRARRGVNNS